MNYQVVYCNSVRAVIWSDEIIELSTFMSEAALREQAYTKTVDIYSFIKPHMMDEADEGQEKRKVNDVTLYYSNLEGELRGFILDVHQEKYIIVSTDKNSQMIFLRSIIIKVFFDKYTKKGFFPIHAASIVHNGNGYGFLAESGGGKSSLFFTCWLYGKDSCIPLGDDTILCKNNKDNEIEGDTLPLNPSLRVGTIDYLPELEKYRTEFSKPQYHVQDQIYIHTKIDKPYNPVHMKAFFWIRFGNEFGVEHITNISEIKKRLAIVICGYKATPVNGDMVTFLDSISRNADFFELIIPKDMKSFYDDLGRWLDIYESNKKQFSNDEVDMEIWKDNNSYSHSSLSV